MITISRRDAYFVTVVRVFLYLFYHPFSVLTISSSSLVISFTSISGLTLLIVSNSCRFIYSTFVLFTVTVALLIGFIWIFGKNRLRILRICVVEALRVYRG